MNKLGFIGYGHMGSVLLRSLLSTQAIQPGQVIVSTRTRNKLDELKRMYPDIGLAENNCEVARKSSLLFLCTGTYQVRSVLTEVGEALHDHTHLVTISGGLEIASIEKGFDGPITKVIPTILAEVLEGITLVCHNDRVSAAAKQYLFQLFRRIGEVRVIPEHQFELGADFTSCAPGLLASICEQFVQAGLKRSDFTYEEISGMFLHTLHGTAKLLLQNKEDFKALTRRMATGGGATEAGVGVLEAELPAVFEKVLAASLQRHEARKQVTRQQFGEYD